MPLHPQEQPHLEAGATTLRDSVPEVASRRLADTIAKGEPGVSVVIPALNAVRHVERLLAALALQTVPPDEVVVVDSSPNEETERVLGSYRGPLAVVYRRLPFAYPGYARNTGVTAARHEWIAFLDCRTVPDPCWLELSLEAARSSQAGIVAGLFTGNPRTEFQKVIHAASYGSLPVRSLPGSLVRKGLYLESGGLIGYVRAGEDLEWFGRLERGGVAIAKPSRPLLVYEGYPETLGKALRKWYQYSRSAADIEVVNDQKLTYCLLFLAMVLLIAFRWNAFIAHWNERSAFYIPHVTKIVGLCLFLPYGVYRGLIRPRRRGIPLAYLLPCRWLKIFLVGFLLDLAKAPGNLLGGLLLLRRRKVPAAK